MRKSELTLALDPSSALPLFLQVSKAVADEIRRGRLRPGDALPGTRALAARLGVHRNTVIAGYRELACESLVSTRSGGGTFVSEPPEAPAPPCAVQGKTPSYAIPAPLSPIPLPAQLPQNALMMFGGLPDARLLPVCMLARAYRRAVSNHGHRLLGYGDPRGHVRLRTELAVMLRSMRGLSATPDNVVITRGSQQAIDLVARSLVTPGDVVGVETFGDRTSWNTMTLAGARLEPLAIDDQGLDVDALESRLETQRLRAVVVTPHHQFPTTVVMSPARRARLARLALSHRMAIVEDDYDHDFHYEGKPILPIAAAAGADNVIYVGSLSKVFAPGLRLGFMVVPPALMDRLISVRRVSDLCGDAATECAVAELLEDGELLRHVRRMRKIYAARRDALAEALGQHLRGVLSFRVPDGGVALWARVDPTVDLPAWQRAGEQLGVLFRGARIHDFHAREQPFMRLGFTYHDEAELTEAARRMARALPR